MTKRANRNLTTAFGTYTLLEQVGQGGVGRVYRGVDEEGHEHAIKILDAAKVSSVKLRRFQNEILFGSRHEHRNVVRIEDYGATEEGPFYVMPFMPLTLRRAMQKGLKPADALRHFGEMLTGIESAHLRGIVHRDLKPENLLIDGEGVLVVADWGAAHFEEEELYRAVETKNDERLANYVYAAPEQRVRGQAVEQSADIFACGLMLNEMFTGAVPLGSDARRIGDVASEYRFLDDVVHQMIAQDPARRPVSVDDVKRRLDAHEVLFTSRQRLDALNKNDVVSTSVSDDPLVREPVRIKGRDYDRNGYFIATLNHQIPKVWADRFHRVTGVTFEFASGLEPGQVEFRGAQARIAVDANRAGDANRYMEQWIERANVVHAEEDRRSRAAFEREQKAAAIRERDREAARLRALQQLPPN